MHVTTASTVRRVGVLWAQAIVSVALLFTLSGNNTPEQKQVNWFENAGHTLVIDAANQFDDVLINHVLPDISPTANLSNPQFERVTFE